jgi:hypothetical protein
MLKNLTPLSVVSATRIEPPLHPPGPEKYVKDFGMETETFDKDAFQKFVYETEYVMEGKTTNGIFAPWMLYKEDFRSMGGHDKLFAPMELEDSDIFNRFHLCDYKLIQSRDAFVYHMTCRGSRFKDGIEIEAEIPLPDGTIWYKPKDSDEYKALRQLKFREWWRKWGCNVLHDEYLMPIVPPKYNIGFVVENCSLFHLELLEPWCSTIYVENSFNFFVFEYIQKEQLITKFNLKERVKFHNNKKENDILVYFDSSKLTAEDFSIIQQLSQIIKNSGEIGEFELGNLKIKINSLKEYQNDLIKI